MDGIIEATQISVSTIIVTYTSSKNVKIRSGWLIWKNCTICRDTRYSDIFTIRKISRVRHKLGAFGMKFQKLDIRDRERVLV